MNFILKSLAAVAAVTVVSGAAQAEGDTVKGEQAFRKCRVCHEVGPEARDKVGPALNGVIGRKIGTGPAFGYSPALKEAGDKGQTWTDENLDKYITDPRSFLPGNKMAFPGIKKDDERADIVAYLKQFTK